MEVFAVLPGGGSDLRFRDELAVGADRDSGAVPPGVLTSSSSVIMSLVSLVCLEAEGVFREESGFPRTCCNEVLGSVARAGEDACVVIWSSISEAATVEPGDGAPSWSIMSTALSGLHGHQSWYAGVIVMVMVMAVIVIVIL